MNTEIKNKDIVVAVRRVLTYQKEAVEYDPRLWLSVDNIVKALVKKGMKREAEAFVSIFSANNQRFIHS